MLITFYMAMLTTRKCVVVITFIFWLCIAGATKIARGRDFLPENITYEDFVDGLTINYWLVMRLVSFVLDYCDEIVGSSQSKEYEKINQKFSTINLLGFSFYLPVLMQGPPLLFSNYTHMIDDNSMRKNNDFRYRVNQLVIALIRVAVISFIAVFMMHYLYTDPVMYDEGVS